MFLTQVQPPTGAQGYNGGDRDTSPPVVSLAKGMYRRWRWRSKWQLEQTQVVGSGPHDQAAVVALAELEQHPAISVPSSSPVTRGGGGGGGHNTW